MPKVLLVHDKESGETLSRVSIDATEIVAKDPKRFRIVKRAPKVSADDAPDDDDDDAPAPPVKKPNSKAVDAK